MLELPKNWANRFLQLLVRDIFDQIRSDAPRIAAARHLIWSSFDLSFRARLRRDNERIEVWESPPLVWHVNKVRFLYVPKLDDSIFEVAARLKSRPFDVMIVPADQGQLAYHALKGFCRKQPCIRSLRDFVDFRHDLIMSYAGWIRSRATLRLLQAYNRRVRQHAEADAIVIDLPRIAFSH